MNVLRRDFLKGLATIPFLGYFAFGFKNNITKGISEKSKDYQKVLGIGELEAPRQKLSPSTAHDEKRIRIGVVGNGWRGERLLNTLGFAHPEALEESRVEGQLTGRLKNYEGYDDLNVDFVGVCDTFEVHAKRGGEFIPFKQEGIEKGNKKGSPIKVFPTYREMIASKDIDAVIIATPDHTHASIAIAAANAGKHVYLEKPMTHTIEEAIELRDTIKQSDIVFQLGHQNRQQMSFKIARELYEKGVLGTVTMVQTFTNRNTVFGAWIRDKAFDHHLGNKNNINWKEFLGKAPWHEFEHKRYFSWQRYSDYGTSVTGNDFTHRYDCVNQVLGLGIPETVVALGGQYYYKGYGDMPDVLSAIFSYPEKGLTMTYDGTLKNEVYRESRILGSEATIDIDGAILMYKDKQSEKFKDIKIDPSDPMYYYAPSTDIDAISTATSRAFMKGGFGPTFIDGKVIDGTYLHLREWLDAIRGHGHPSCDIDQGFEEAVTFNLANLAYVHKKPVRWDKSNEKVIIGG
ncbi:gfo/Idh/MocA family oxidoreductase [Mariniphaga sediminis]|uniref:Gfo/Idh/MocA family oxidoreductase n=1 Tax=Mariniphaga sediminis TaxID=1628158 RepID=A0A399D1T6_9BACT|nr:Gfo/Idh/MocA family oxidoreductase [Mariniphaga sediminis]RIH65426.1 gfo/Idh/MocA family oxidoreductase [Mariniphaga sediminis]